jgi:hypothetical protein
MNSTVNDDMKTNVTEGALDTKEINENRVVDDKSDANSDTDCETIVLTDEVWATCPENPWVWSTRKKWLLMSAVQFYGFLALVQIVVVI